MNSLSISVETQILLDEAYREAVRMNAQEVDVVHVLLALLKLDVTTQKRFITAHSTAAVLGKLHKKAAEWYENKMHDQVEPEPSTAYIDLMRAAQKHAIAEKSIFIEPIHLFQAIFNSSVRVTEFLSSVGVAPSSVHQTSKTPMLDKFGRDLTALARQDALPHIIGRTKEAQNLSEILLRHGKNSALLLGEAGVGKTAVVEKLAQIIATGEIPALIDKRLIELSPTALVAGTAFRGDFEARMEQILTEIRDAKNIIIVIDEFHTLVRSGSVEGGAADAANMLKPALARGELTCIGITTFDEFSRYIEPDNALSRRFTTITVDEPSLTETHQILEGLIAGFAKYHGLSLNNEIIPTIVTLSERYLPSQRQPDKSIDVLATTCSRAQLRMVEVDTELVAEVISEMAGVPIHSLTGDESKQLLSLESQLTAQVIGQSEAVRVVAEAVRIARLGLRPEQRPVGVFLFTGPSGVGKTQLARALAQVLFGTEDALLRFDMSEYAEKHTASRLIGAPPGYIGHETEGQLTRALRYQPHSVVLFDEVEKAHPEIFDLFLQLFDNGRLTDNHNRLVDGRHALFIMTSNISAEPRISGFERVTGNVMQALKQYFRVEFLNRIDQIVIFNALSTSDLVEIAKLKVNALCIQLEAKQISLSISEDVYIFLAENARKTNASARAIERLIQQHLTVPISEHLLKQSSNTSKTVIVACHRDALTFTWR